MSASTPDARVLAPEIARAIHDSFARQGMMTLLGARLAHLAPGLVRITLPYADGVGQQRELFHGGAIGAIADTAGGYAALSGFPAGSEVVTVEYKINFIRPARGEVIHAEARIERAGKSLSVARIDVTCESAGDARPCALVQATFLRVSG